MKGMGLYDVILNFTLWFLTGGWIAQIQVDSMHICSQSPSGSGRVWLCLAARCSQDAFNFLFFTLDLAKTSGYWQESSSDDIFCAIPTWHNMKYLNVYVQLKCRDGIAKLCTYVYSCYAPWNLKKQKQKAS